MKVNRILLILGAFAAVAVIGVVVGGGSSFLGNSGEVVVTTDVGTGDSAAPVDQAATTAAVPSKSRATTAATTATRSAAAVAQSPAADASRPVAKPGPLLLLNPAIGAPGSSVGVSGSGFDAGATVNVSVKRDNSDKGSDIGFAQADQGGSFGGVNFTIPDGMVGGTFLVVAQQDKSDKKAAATGQVQGASPSVKFGTQVGKAGDRITISAKGFAANENVNIFFNSIGGDPIAQIKADQSGGLARASVTVPYGASGNNAFILMGEKSQSPVTVPFLMLNFYPSAGISVYAMKADTAITFSGSGFGPDEKVSIFLNSPQSPPVAFVDTNADGAFQNAGNFVVPFSLSGKNTFIFVGDKSQAGVTAGFDVLPYTPYAEASTYGARPGTTITFYGRDFARSEVVRVFVGRSQNSAGNVVSCFKTDDRGNINGGGGYTIPHDAQAGKTAFSLIGDRSKGEALVAFQIMDAGGPVQPSPDEMKQFHCPYDDQPADGGQPAPQPAAPAAPQAAPSGGQPATPANGPTQQQPQRATATTQQTTQTLQTTQTRPATSSAGQVPLNQQQAPPKVTPSAH